MSSTSAARTLIRILEMMRCLPRTGSGISSAELQQKLEDRGFQVEKRTVERDLKTLHEAFSAHIRCNDKSRPFGWRWHDNTDFEVVTMSITEAVSLQAIDETIKPLLPASVLASLNPRFTQARKLLNELAQNNPQASWARKVRNVQPGMPMLPPQIDPEVLATVQTCLLADECIQVGYQSADSDAPRQRLLHPLALVQRGPMTYLVAVADGKPDPFLYAVHRIRSAERSYLPARAFPDFDIDHYIAEGHLHFGDTQASGEAITLEARLDKWLMKILAESPLSADQTLNPQGEHWHLQCTVRDTRQLLWWILSQGPAIKILGPAPLRKRVAAALASASAHYTGDEPDGA